MKTSKTLKEMLIEWHSVIAEVKAEIRAMDLPKEQKYDLFLSHVKRRHHDAIAGTFYNPKTKLYTEAIYRGLEK